jgi:CheY-like chemotaxis protein/anti-sigma regulatory factor (Ser/Thr protein kinase)
MAQPPLSASEQRKVGQIETAGWHLLGLIDEVLDLARIESGAVGISMEPVNVEWVVDETIALVATMARERGLTIVNQGTQNGAENAPAWALANRRRLVQVLSNLLSNAIKYNRPHGVVTVSVASSGNGRMTISVADTGRGFTPDQMDRLYQPFTRFKREGDSIQGTGIGLVITRNLVHLMGGDMKVTSVVDEGSNFMVELAEALAPLAVEVTEPEPQNAANPPAPGEERRLLYVEDNPANVELFEQIIRMRSGYRLTVATDGLAGLALARAQMPHLAVVDIDLPGIDGIELCRRLRADGLTSGMPLIALSANAMGDDIARARNAGFDVYLTKPIDVIRLLAEIERLLPT